MLSEDDSDAHAPGKIKRLTLREQILHRLGTYLGSDETEVSGGWRIPTNSLEDIHHSNFGLVPALCQLGNEASDNVTDHMVRCSKKRNKSGRVSEMRFDVSSDGTMSVWNNGSCIKMTKDRDTGVNTVTLAMFTLLTSSNYDDSEDREDISGRNGYGIKLFFIMSLLGMVETFDSAKGILFTQKTEKNMSVIHPFTKTTIPEEDRSVASDWTRITGKMDLKRFHLEEMTRDHIDYFRRMCLEIAATYPELKVVFNGTPLVVPNGGGMMGLAKMYLDAVPSADSSEIVSIKLNARTTIAVAPVPKGKSFSVTSVNGTFPRTGSHVRFVQKQISDAALKKVARRVKGERNVKVTAAHINGAYALFGIFKMARSRFKEQSKWTLCNPVGELRPDMTLKKSQMNNLLSGPLFDRIMEIQLTKTQNNLVTSVGGSRKASVKVISKIPHAVDAPDAGKPGERGRGCTLIAVEGPSAGTLAMSGIGARPDKDKFGYICFKGKMLNVRGAPMSAFSANAECVNLCKMTNLVPGKRYHTRAARNTLRFDHVMLMMDADSDGPHITWQFISMVHYFWPELLLANDFLSIFKTPIRRAISKRNKDEVKYFYTEVDFDEWLEELGGAEQVQKLWVIEHIKGLGSNTAEEARLYFSNMESHQVFLEWSEDEDEKMGPLLHMAFSKDTTGRKTWMTKFKETDKDVDLTNRDISYCHYAQLLQNYGVAANHRSICSAIDGMTPAQRQSIVTALMSNCDGMRNQGTSVKLTSWAGNVLTFAAYEHAAAGLCDSMMKMGTQYVGNNNVLLTKIKGQGGTRSQNGSDSAASRYLSGFLTEESGAVLLETDMSLLPSEIVDGNDNIPKFVVPVVPWALVNGSSGIGYGSSNNVAMHDVHEIIGHLRTKLTTDPDLDLSKVTLVPHFKGFLGTVVPTAEGVKPTVKKHKPGIPFSKVSGHYKANVGKMTQLTAMDIFKDDVDDADADQLFAQAVVDVDFEYPAYVITGEYEHDEDEGTIVITEIPTGWTKAKSITQYHAFLADLLEKDVITDLTYRPSDIDVHFTVEVVGKWTHRRILDTFNLEHTIHTNNMNMFTKEGTLRHFRTVGDIVALHWEVRLEYYEKRRLKLIRLLEELCREKLLQSVYLERVVVDKSIVILDRDDGDIVADICESLEDHDITLDEAKRLRGLPQRQLSKQGVAKALKISDKAKKDIVKLQDMTPEKMWIDDLDTLEAVLERTAVQEAKNLVKRRAQEAMNLEKMQKASTKKLKALQSKKKKRKKRTSPDDDDEEPMRKKRKTKTKKSVPKRLRDDDDDDDSGSKEPKKKKRRKERKK
jgi:DNA topoisomerase-2